MVNLRPTVHIYLSIPDHANNVNLRLTVHIYLSIPDHANMVNLNLSVSCVLHLISSIKNDSWFKLRLVLSRLSVNNAGVLLLRRQHQNEGE